MPEVAPVIRTTLLENLRELLIFDSTPESSWPFALDVSARAESERPRLLKNVLRFSKSDIEIPFNFGVVLLLRVAGSGSLLNQNAVR
ncbi:MAG: hypothetical protein CME65_11370 [Halobacteriovoraceae bacterium]|nr:hypothetical protein [Halobacteriovoraceae bacterium]|tara:strand:- start:3425 stop:3685 length:261 start_codon:yes stop_codon:yes gene_type:complete